MEYEAWSYLKEALSAFYPSSREDPPRSGGAMRGESLFGVGVG